MKLKIYIAGKVTGIPQDECAEKFQYAENYFNRTGFEAINPLKVVGTWDIEWNVAMRKCIAAMMQADAVYLLPCYKESRGAMIEMELALKLKIPITRNRDRIRDILKHP